MPRYINKKLFFFILQIFLSIRFYQKIDYFLHTFLSYPALIGYLFRGVIQAFMSANCLERLVWANTLSL